EAVADLLAVSRDAVHTIGVVAYDVALDKELGHLRRDARRCSGGLEDPPRGVAQVGRVERQHHTPPREKGNAIASPVWLERFAASAISTAARPSCPVANGWRPSRTPSRKSCSPTATTWSPTAIRT